MLIIGPAMLHEPLTGETQQMERLGRICTHLQSSCNSNVWRSPSLSSCPAYSGSPSDTAPPDTSSDRKQANKYKMMAVMSQGRPAFLTWQFYPSSLITQTLAYSGFDGLVIDLQHGLIDYAGCVAMLTALQSHPTAPTAVVRVPQGIDEGIMAKVLDAGASTVICPMGIRSYGPVRAIAQRDSSYLSRANQEVQPYAMIETKQALDNLEEICSTPGLAGVFIGPSDLAISMGLPPSGEPTRPEILAAIRKVVTVAHAKGIKAGMWGAGSGRYAGEIVQTTQLDWVVSCSDMGLLMDGADANLANIHRALKSPTQAYKDIIY
eukprot:g56658.t1